MGIMAHMSILGLSVVVVCGNPPGLVVPEKSPSVSRQARSVNCDKWCDDPDVPGSYYCCDGYPSELTPDLTPKSTKWSQTVVACIKNNYNKVLRDISFDECKAACEATVTEAETRFVCKSINYWLGGKDQNDNDLPIHCQLSAEDNTSSNFVEPCYTPFENNNLYAQLNE